MDKILPTLRSHPGWFFVGCMATGVAISRLPFLIERNGNIALLPDTTTWVLAGLVAGSLLPQRRWRWGVAMVLAFPIMNLVLNGNHWDALFMQLFTLPLLPVTAAPILVGAYAGSLLAQWRTLPQIRPKPSAARNLRLILSAYVLCSAPVFFIPENVVFVLWLVLATILSAVFTARFKIRPVLSMTFVTASVFAAEVTSATFDLIRGGPSHNLIPLELWIVSLPVILVAGISAILARLLERRYFSS